MNTIDLAIVGLIGVMVLWGGARGAIREAFSVLSWVAAYTLAGRYSPVLAEQLNALTNGAMIRHALAYGVVFVLVLLVTSIVGVILTASARAAGMGSVNRLLGLLLGGVRGVVVVTAFVLVAGLTAAPQTMVWQQARLIPWFTGLVMQYRAVLPDSLQQHLNYQE